jgi:hypothetical protein
MPHLVQILLPVYDNVDKPFQRITITKSDRAPAEGLWNSGSTVKRDDIVVVEVMVDSLDRTWWKDYRRELERLFCEDEIILRAQPYEHL